MVSPGWFDKASPPADTSKGDASGVAESIRVNESQEASNDDREEVVGTAGGTRTPAKTDGVDWEELLTAPPLSAAQLAERIDQPAGLVERFLRYQRKVQPFCYVPDDNPRKNSPRYLHKMPDILPPLQEWLKKRQKKIERQN